MSNHPIKVERSVGGIARIWFLVPYLPGRIDVPEQDLDRLVEEIRKFQAERKKAQEADTQIIHAPIAIPQPIPNRAPKGKKP
jgi:hypothetical protein